MVRAGNTNMLTDVAIRAMKPADKPYKKADSGGLFILVQPNGKKLWRLAYRFHGKQKLLSGGAYPIVGLSEARKWRNIAKAQLSDGIDPSMARRDDRRAAKAAADNTFQTLGRAWIESRRPSWSPKYAGQIEARLEADLFPALGASPITKIDPPMLLDALRKIERRSAIEMAHRVRNYCSEIFRYAIAEEKCLSDPSRDIKAAMKQPPPVKHRAKIGAAELPTFFDRLNRDEGERLSHLALRWTIMTMVRTQETRFAVWSEFEGLNGPEPLWRIPAERMKMRSEHLVPLPRQAVALLQEIRELNVYATAGNQRLGKCMFPVGGSKTGTISENRMLDIMYRMGYRGKATVHGFRGLASTVLNESGRFQPDWIEAQLAHAPRGVRAAYNSAKYLTHRREMLQWWADFLDQEEQTGLLFGEPIKREAA